MKNLTNREPKIGQTVAGAELGDQMFVCLHEIFFLCQQLKRHSLTESVCWSHQSIHNNVDLSRVSRHNREGK